MVWTQQTTRLHSNHVPAVQLQAACRQQRNCIPHRPAASSCATGTNSPQIASLAPIAPVKLHPETKARHKRPAGWVAPGPQPHGNPSNDPGLISQEHETLSFLTGDWRIFQLQNGHRWSMDDMMTAYIALQEAAKMQQQAESAAAAHVNQGTQQPRTRQQLAPITQTLDIGCGIGSVLLMVAWGLRRMYMEQQATAPGLLYPQQQQELGQPNQEQTYAGSQHPPQQQGLGQPDQQQTCARSQHPQQLLLQQQQQEPGHPAQQHTYTNFQHPQQQQQQQGLGQPAQQQTYTSSQHPQQQQQQMLVQPDNNNHHQQQQQQPQTLRQADQQQRHAQQLLQHFNATSLGVEAQTVSYQLAQRSILYNLGPNAQKQIQVINADLREGIPADAEFQLITGTPPYIPQGAGGRSVRPQKESCCLEVRGAVEDYCTAAAGALAPDGVLVVCMGLQGQPARFQGRRTQMAAAAAGLVITRQVTVITRERKLPLFAVYVMRRGQEILKNSLHWQEQGGGVYLKKRQQECAQQPEQLSSLSLELQVASGQLQGVEEQFLVQYADGLHTDAWHAAREAMGLPPLV